jgi:hypothetical protein
MASRLLSLPGELRNRVYDFALSTCDGLDFSEDDQSVGWFCIPEMHIEAHRNMYDTRAGASASSLSRPITMRTVNGGRIIANQLQFVCKQLRRETKALEIVKNTIQFSALESTTASSFMASLPPYLVDHPHRLVFRVQEDNWHSNMFAKMTEFCRAHPRSAMRLYHPKLDSSHAVRLLFTALLIKHGAGRDTKFVQMLSDDEDRQQQLLKLLTTEIKEQQVTSIPDNLLFFPYDVSFDEKAFRISCRLSAIIHDVLVPELENGVEGLVTLARGCYEQGF